ncbi:lysophospholipid acyltransferase family protein [Bacteroidales bacterium OttesenSCG-928-A17]|nr:lysophospholipid acyltransferase family protein [Bacteroidales bacterium OttesenSCG-928-A17]
MNVINTIKYYLVKSAWICFSCLPLPVMYVFSDALYYPFFYLIRYRRKITRKNLIAAFPEKNLDEIKKIEKRFYHFFLDLFVETCKYATISEKEIKKRLKFVNIEEVNALLRQGQSISTYMGHYCNWEWVTSLPLHLDKGVIASQIYKLLESDTMERLLKNNRSRLGAVNVEMKQTMRWIKQQMEEGTTFITGFISDQSPRKIDVRYFVKFLNHNAPVFTGTEKITKRYGLAAYYLKVRRVKRGYYEATFVRLHENPQSLPDFKLTEIYYNHLEEAIKEQPENYLWTHKRFKHATKL